MLRYVLFGLIYLAAFFVFQEPAIATEARIVVSIPEKILRVYLPTGDVRTYPVAVPRVTPSRTLEGVVEKVDIHPWWHPTPATRRAYWRKYHEVLAEDIAPGDPKNAMGVAKLLIAFKNSSTPIRIHGTNKPEQIGQAVSRGCIRMFNEDILSLISITSGYRILVTISISPIS